MIAAPFLIVWGASVLVVLPALVGRLVGERVYRWPAVLATIAVAAPNLVAPIREPDLDLVAALGVAGIGGFVAGATAWDRWRARPRALRAGVPR